MDPNTALTNLRDALRRLDDPTDENIDNMLAAVNDLRESAAALDRWLSQGGFLPQYWTRAGENNRPIRPFDILLCEACDTDREVGVIAGEAVVFRVCGHVHALT